MSINMCIITFKNCLHTFSRDVMRSTEHMHTKHQIDDGRMLANWRAKKGANGNC